MTRPVAARGGRLLGRSLLTLANLITLAAPVAADWNDSHIFNERWPGHARFHGVTALGMAATLSSVNIWFIWSGSGDWSGPGDRSGDRATVRFFAAAVPVAYWAPFFLAPLVHGTAVDDPPHPVPRLAGVPTNLLGAAATTATATAGWVIAAGPPRRLCLFPGRDAQRSPSPLRPVSLRSPGWNRLAQARS
jgi:hypothetical protein